MQYLVTSTNMEVSESMKVLAGTKLAKIEKRFNAFPDDTKFCKVVMDTFPNDMFKVKLELIVNGKPFFAETKGYNLETALIDSVEELEKQLEKWKNRGA